MNIFTDFHHQGLLESLIILFEGRLGDKLYRPIGMDWYPEYWKLNDLEVTAQQYLKEGSQPIDGTPALNEPDALSRTVTLEQFKNMKFDILIASLPQHIEPFKKLIAYYQPQAKLIFQVGNVWNIPNNIVQNVMASAKCLPPIQTNYIEYHQEFPLNIYYPPANKPEKRIYSFINCLNVVSIYQKDWELFLELEKLMPTWEFKSFGGQCRDGFCAGDKEVARKMRESAFGFQCKSEGDGYGHIIHALARSGIPLITRLSDYRGKLAEPLLIDGVTCIAVDGKEPKQIAEEIEKAYKTAFIWKNMSQAIAKKFKEVVNFDAEEKEIRMFIERLR